MIQVPQLPRLDQLATPSTPTASPSHNRGKPAPIRLMSSPIPASPRLRLLSWTIAVQREKKRCGGQGLLSHLKIGGRWGVGGLRLRGLVEHVGGGGSCGWVGAGWGVVEVVRDLGSFLVCEPCGVVAGVAQLGVARHGRVWWLDFCMTKPPLGRLWWQLSRRGVGVGSRPEQRMTSALVRTVADVSVIVQVMFLGSRLRRCGRWRGCRGVCVRRRLVCRSSGRCRGCGCCRG